MLATLGIGGAAIALGGQPQPEAKAPSPLRVEAVRITPERPGTDTLCRLAVRIHNAGERPAYAFAFDVSLDGAALPVYENQLFLQAIPAGESAEVELYNFWTTETGRSRPADGKLTVEVTVREALWLEITQEPAGEGASTSAPGSAEAEPIEVWSPAGEVPGLPVRAAVTLELAP